MESENNQDSAKNDGPGPRFDIQPLDRFNAFSDGVLAIVITLLVLELPVPPEGASLPQGIAQTWPDFLGYFISFAFVGGMWLTHARLTKLMRRGDSISFQLNLVMLLFVSLVPFTTKVMVKHMTGPDARVAVAAYGLNVLLASGLLTGLMAYAARNRHMVADGIADEELKQTSRQRRAALIVLAVSVLIAVIAPIIAVGLYILVTVMFIVHPFIRARRGPRQSAR
jgi:uncharacterized membrane protein